MVSKVKTMSFEGIVPFFTTVEVHVTNGLPCFTIVGLPDKSISESKERVRSALQSIGITLSTSRIIVNLSPAGKEKHGTHYDLAIAAAIMVAFGKLKLPERECIVLGELSLDGYILPVKGALLAATLAKETDTLLVCPKKNYKEARIAGREIEIICPDNLKDLIEKLEQNKLCEDSFETISNNLIYEQDPFHGIIGQEVAKRAVIIAAAGRHHITMIGQQGVGKSTIAASIQHLMEDLNEQDALEVTSIYSVAGILKEGEMIKKPPYRSPHSSSSLAAIIGGGSFPKPGEVSLAHKGVLFLDELPEFQQIVIDSLRTPIEQGKVFIARSSSKVDYPSDFHLVVSMNPCKCGMLLKGTCSCVKKGYMNKISAPIQDRIDLKVILEKVNFLEEQEVISYEHVRNEIKNATQRQINRFGKLNSKCTLDELRNFGMFHVDAMNFLKKFAQEKEMSVRAFVKAMAISRTIADLASSETVYKEHVAEALFFKN